MRILFVHQNFPAQFKHLAPEMVARGHEVVVLTAKSNSQPITLPNGRYGDIPETPKAGFATNFAEKTNRGYAAARCAAKLRDEFGFEPDVVFGHPGWGEMIFLRTVWPRARYLVFAEFYYQPAGLDTDFDPEFQTPSVQKQMSTIARQAGMAHAMAHADAALAPTRFQASTYPDCFRDRITVVHDGVDTERLAPDPAASVTLPGSTRTFRAGDEVLTFINRNLEPYRGYHVFMRALPEVLAARPEAQVVIVGGDDVSYGLRPKDGRSWKKVILDEVGDRIDLTRVHFTGRVPYPVFTGLMQVSRVHAYLTYPFVLSWSMIEAMSMGAHVVGSNTPPVAEVIEDGVNGRLVEFFDVPGWSAALIEGLAHPERFTALREAARRTAVERYDLRTICLPKIVDFVENAGA